MSTAPLFSNFIRCRVIAVKLRIFWQYLVRPTRGMRRLNFHLTLRRLFYVFMYSKNVAVVIHAVSLRWFEVRHDVRTMSTDCCIECTALLHPSWALQNVLTRVLEAVPSMVTTRWLLPTHALQILTECPVSICIRFVAPADSPWLNKDIGTPAMLEPRTYNVLLLILTSLSQPLRLKLPLNGL